MKVEETERREKSKTRSKGIGGCEKKEKSRRRTRTTRRRKKN